ncbi:glycoside hydrolase family 3 N-terminal domain-containing protein [Asanoa sp. WMMD1127]|uniref:glycoside hydrolase family 3 protein n=1 Tax=Asanoa sp. WMMD1127 TaxID=3016107 RepID=UPI002416CEEC|nr:glycoside hydrolase family 3 N-terminal domain-containing protein [Asanoa sp. WMMD1127]MDG4827367.1 glycoside hydrolase family 3 N-terminal domain-containing protein [Asanoa sp. WMMD1127]
MASPRSRLALLFAAVVAAILVAITACGKQAPRAAAPSSSPTPAATAAPATPSPGGDPAARAAALVGTLSDEQLAGQVLMPYAYGSSATKVTPASAAGNQKLGKVDTPAQMIQKYHLGGLILVGFSADDPTSTNQATTNVDNPKQITELTGGLQQAAGGTAPIFIGTDQEFGTVTRIKDGVTLLPSAMALGAGGNPAGTQQGWKVAGDELRAMGLNVDFAPDADVLGTADGGVIGSRSFGSDPRAVSDQVAASVRGLQSAGVAATLKHFPGHGSTPSDSHTDLPVIGKSRADLDKVDLAPFRSGIDAGAQMVMSGHLDVKSIEPGVPASFSHKALVDVLRGQLGFKGVVVSDALNMAPAEKWPAGEAAVRALNAGNDLLLMPPNVGAAHQGLVDGLHNGSLKKERLVEAATRDLTLRFTLADARTGGQNVPASQAHLDVAGGLAAAAVTQLRGQCGAPMQGPVSVTASGGRDTAKATLERALKAEGVRVVPSGGRVVHLVGYGDGAGDLNQAADTTVGMDTPYVLGGAKSPNVLATYSSTPGSLKALAKVLAGKQKPTGKSPVAVSGLPRSVC